MSGVRLPLIGERTNASVPRAARTPSASRVVPTRTFVSVAGADADTRLTPALMRFAEQLLRALAAEGRPAAVLAVAGEAQSDQLAALREAGAERVVELGGDEAELGARALAALELLPRDALAVGVGSALACALQPLLALRIAPPHAFDGRADVELPRDCLAVSSAIAARLARTNTR